MANGMDPSMMAGGMDPAMMSGNMNSGTPSMEGPSNNQGFDMS